MITPATPTDQIHRKTLIRPSLTMVEDWGLDETYEACEVDWIDWQPEAVETLFKDGKPEGLFFHKILENDRMSSRWSKIVSSARSVWLHALVDAANDHPRSPLLRQAMDRLSYRVAQPGQDPLNSGGGNWGDDGVAERVLLYFLRNQRLSATGESLPLPANLRKCLSVIEGEVGPLERLEASGQAWPSERNMLLGMGVKLAQVETSRRTPRR